MVDARFLDLIDQVARRIRFVERPFGGLQVRSSSETSFLSFFGQLISTGDFFQLPPCNSENMPPLFAFHSKAWVRVTQRFIYLKSVHRQADPGMPPHDPLHVLNTSSFRFCSSIKRMQGWLSFQGIHLHPSFPRPQI